MSRLKKIFSQKNKRILNVYCTAGFPQLKSTVQIIENLQKAGADIIELGMPYSDPLADGEVIQSSGAVALANGMTIQILFAQLKNCRTKTVGETLPIILMGYMNPVLQYGFEKFCADAAAVGIDGLIIPDLPMFEFETLYGSTIKKYGLDFIFLVTPETSEERIKKLDELSTGFLYAVSSSSTTGSGKNFTDVNEYLLRLKNYKLTNPILVGFGIHNKTTFNTACEHTNGAIIGSAFIKALQHAEDIEVTTLTFVKQILE
jgi:tryptophan synthase alpha chain